MNRPKTKKAPNIICIILGGLLLFCVIGLRIADKDLMSTVNLILLGILGVMLLLGGIGGIYLDKQQKLIDKAKEEVEKISKK